MEIYWIKDKQRCGPATVPDVISRLQTGELTPESLGWHEGCRQWQPLRELPALADFLNRKPDEDTTEPQSPREEAPPAPSAEEAPQAAPLPTIPAASPQQEPAETEGSTRVFLPSPMARLLARLVDYALYAAIFGGIITLRQEPYSSSLLLNVNPLLWLPLLVLEALMLASTGTTPGKALMGIRVTTFGDVPHLSRMRALTRSFMAFTLGMGLMIPQLLPIMLAIQYWLLRRRGITPWDARCSTLPTQKTPATPSRYALAVVSLYVCSVLFFSSMRPWIPGMLEEISGENPELAQTLRELMPEMQETPPPAPEPETETVAPAVQDTSLPGL